MDFTVLLSLLLETSRRTSWFLQMVVLLCPPLLVDLIFLSCSPSSPTHGGTAPTLFSSSFYTLLRSGIESRWGLDFPPVQPGPGPHPASCKIGTGSFPGVKCGRGVLLTTHPLLVPRSQKSSAIPLPTHWATPGL